MPRKRKSLFTGERLPDTRGRGQSRGSAKRDAAEWTRVKVLTHAVTLHLDGATRAEACAAAGDLYGLDTETVRELFAVDALDAAKQILKERIALKKMTPEQALTAFDALANRIARNRSKQQR